MLGVSTCREHAQQSPKAGHPCQEAAAAAQACCVPYWLPSSLHACQFGPSHTASTGVPSKAPPVGDRCILKPPAGCCWQQGATYKKGRHKQSAVLCMRMASVSSRSHTHMAVCMYWQVSSRHTHPSSSIPHHSSSDTVQAGWHSTGPQAHRLSCVQVEEQSCFGPTRG